MTTDVSLTTETAKLTLELGDRGLGGEGGVESWFLELRVSAAGRRLTHQSSENSRHTCALREAHHAVKGPVLDHKVVDVRDGLVEACR